jgi:hypothetical protein
MFLNCSCSRVSTLADEVKRQKQDILISKNKQNEKFIKH